MVLQGNIQKDSHHPKEFIRFKGSFSKDTKNKKKTDL